MVFVIVATDEGEGTLAYMFIDWHRGRPFLYSIDYYLGEESTASAISNALRISRSSFGTGAEVQRRVLHFECYIDLVHTSSGYRVCHRLESIDVEWMKACLVDSFVHILASIPGRQAQAA